ncbi:MAG: hypothetical protein V3W09_04320, partial [Nitrososphaerales archaeon]
MKTFDVNPDLETGLRIDSKRRSDLESWLTMEINDALSARHWQEEEWRESMRRYAGEPPRDAFRLLTVEEMNPVEVPLAAIAHDAIYAQEISLIFGVSPLLTTKSNNKRWIEHNKAFQRFLNYMAVNLLDIREASEEMLLDKNKLGTGILYVPWTQQVKKTKTRRILTQGPKARNIPIEDFLVPGGARTNLNEETWVAIRFNFTEAEFDARAKRGRWRTDDVLPTANVSQTRQHRETLGQTRESSKKQGKMFEIWMVWAYFDIDNDGEEEDLFLVFDKTSHKILKEVYNPFDSRPFTVARFMRRGGLFYGIGIPEVLKVQQEIASNTMNFWLNNAYLANARAWLADPSTGLEGSMSLWSGRVIQSSNPQGLQPLVLADTYQSLPQLFAINMSLSERRTGVNDLTQPRPSQVLGSRTPGITALSLLQQSSQRFTPSFDSGRFGIARGVKEGAFRFQERILAGDVDVEDFIREVMTEEPGNLVIELLRNERFDDAIAVEMTASSASQNKESERQNAIMLAQLLGTYYSRVIELSQIISSPQVPPPVKKVAERVANGA